MSIDPRQARGIIRKAVKRVPEGEDISHLNIMPMMDMMTILLVAFIFQVSTGAEAISAGGTDLPRSTSQEEMPEASTVIIIGSKAIVVEHEEIVAVRNGKVDDSQKKHGRSGIQITKLVQFLAALRESNNQELIKQNKTPPKIPEVMIIGEKDTRYRLLFEVMNSARHAEYRRFRLVTLKQGGI